MSEKKIAHFINTDEILPEELGDDPIIYGKYEEREAHDILKWINRIKVMQMYLVNQMEDIDTWAAKRILDSSWHLAEQNKRVQADKDDMDGFERQFLEELLKSAHDEEV